MPTKKKVAKKKSPEPKKDVAAFVHHVHTNRSIRMILKKGWEEVIREGKKRGFKFTKKELHDHLKKKYNVKGLPKEDEPDTCICI